MDKILIDINVLLDAVFKRDINSIALIARLIDSRKELYITASMAATMDYFLNKYKTDKTKFRDRFLRHFKIITSSGMDAAIALGHADSEDTLIALSFKRICPDGVIITRDKKFEGFDISVFTPEAFLDALENTKNIEHTGIPILDLKKQYRYMLEEIDNSVLQTIADAKYILGPQVKELEDRIARYLGVRHCIGMSSGTEALVLSLRASAIKLTGQEYFGRNDLILTTPFTFTATGDAILRAGATPVFIDIDPHTYNIDTARIKEFLTTHRTQLGDSGAVGVVPVHLYGRSCPMDEIMDIAKEYNLFVIEDVAQAFGGKWRDRKLGSIGAAGCFSFFPSKNLGGFGDGGMVSTNDDDLAGLARMLLKHGGKDKYNVDHIGYNARLDTLQAAVILAKLPYIDEFNELRRKIAETYSRELADIKEIALPDSEQHGIYHVCHQYTIRVDRGRRDALQKYLNDNGVSTMVYYPYPLHKMKVFGNGRSIAYGSLENAEAAASEVLSLPIEPLQDEGVTKSVISKIKQFYSS